MRNLQSDIEVARFENLIGHTDPDCTCTCCCCNRVADAAEKWARLVEEKSAGKSIEDASCLLNDGIDYPV
jgi:hypothetical protein